MPLQSLAMSIIVCQLMHCKLMQTFVQLYWLVPSTLLSISLYSTFSYYSENKSDAEMIEIDLKIRTVDIDPYIMFIKHFNSYNIGD